MNIPQQIKNKRKSLKESQTVFGKRFEVSHAAVSDWESGKSEASYKVIIFVLDLPKRKYLQCHRCKGMGFYENT